VGFSLEILRFMESVQLFIEKILKTETKTSGTDSKCYAVCTHFRHTKMYIYKLNFMKYVCVYIFNIHVYVCTWSILI